MSNDFQKFIKTWSQKLLSSVNLDSKQTKTNKFNPAMTSINNVNIKSSYDF